MKTICFFSGDITRSGGTEYVAVMLANALARQGKYKILFVSLTEQAKNKKPYFRLEPKIRHYALAKRWITPGIAYLPIIPKLRHFLQKRHVDLLIDIDTVLDVLSVPAASFTKIKILSWEHFNYQFENSIGYRRWIIRHMTTRTDLLVTLTKGDQKQFLRAFIKGDQKRFLHAFKHRQKKRLSVCAIQNPIPDPFIYPRNTIKKSRIRSQSAQNKKKPWIITAGRLTYQKGMDYLLQIAELVLKKYPDWKWIVLGDGEERETMENRLQEKGLSDRLILAGHTADIAYFLDKAQIFVPTSRWEGMPMCLLEAKAHGLTCVSFDIATGPREIILDRRNGFLIPAFQCGQMADCIGKLIENETLRKSFSENAKLGIEKFQMDVVLQKWDRALNKTLSNDTKTPGA